MAYALDGNVRSALKQAYRERLASEAELVAPPGEAPPGEAPRRATPAFGIPNPTRPASAPVAAMPRRQSPSDRTLAMDFGDSRAVTLNDDDAPPATQAYAPGSRSPLDETTGGNRTLAYADRDMLDRALAEAAAELPQTKEGMKRTMAYSLSDDQFAAVRAEAEASAQAEAAAYHAQSTARPNAATAPSRNKPRLGSTMAFLPPASPQVGSPQVGSPQMAAGAGEARQPQAWVNASMSASELRSTMAFDAVADEPTGSRAPYLGRQQGAADEGNLGSTLVAGVGRGAAFARAADDEVTRLSPGPGGAMTAPPVSIGIEDAAALPTATPTPIGMGYSAPMPSGAMPPGQNWGGEQQGGYPAAPPGGYGSGMPTEGYPGSAPQGFVRPPNAPLAMQQQQPPLYPAPQVTVASNKTTIIIAAVVGAMTLLVLLAAAGYFLLG